MNWKRTARWSWLILPFLLLALWPSVAAAGPPGVPAGSNAVLYEVTENLKFNSFVKMKRRQATSALMGAVKGGTAICPTALGGSQIPAGDCALIAVASNNIDINPSSHKLGMGPVVGTFDVVVQGDNPVDGPELVVLRGDLSGNIDLSQAVLFAATSGLAGAPIGTITGRWNGQGVAGGPLAGLHVHGTFTGTFRLPFINPLDSTMTPLYMTDPSVLTVVPVAANELSLGVPTVRLEMNFTAN